MIGGERKEEMIVRQAEMKELTTIYEESDNSITLLVGSQRSGKEEFLREFAKNKSMFYFRARNASPQEELRLLSDEVERGLKNPPLEKTYASCLKAIVRESKGKAVLVVDEFQNSLRRSTDFWEALLELKESDAPVMILLCISAISWYRKEIDEVLGKNKKKVDARIELTDLTFLELVRAFPEFNVSECVKTYGVIGGVPQYLSVWNPKKNIRDNICETILNPKGALFTEAEDYIGSELRELSVYETILSSIARGNEKLNDLFSDTGYSRAKISVYLKNLAAFDVVEKVVSFETGGWDYAKKGVYRIKNHFLNFWFRFVYPHLSDLYMMEPRDFYQEYISRELDEYLRRFFVDVCHEYLELLSRVGKAPIRIEKMGTWVGKTGTIDVIGEDSIRNHVVGICNWDRPILRKSQYDELLENMKLARLKAEAIFLFSAQSFDPMLIELSKANPSLILVDMKEL